MQVFGSKPLKRNRKLGIKERLIVHLLHKGRRTIAQERTASGGRKIAAPLSRG